jgi:alanyl-tRNA synthetase
MNSAEIRAGFLKFFRDRKHTIVPSAPLVPKDDPSLLFTAAGMVPFKPLFTGTIPLPYQRAASIQKCLRLSDLDLVGRTRRHLTFFEMLGNFSFGDYFKEEAIAWAWEFLTEVLNIDHRHLLVSVHQDDAEAYRLWRDKIGLNSERIFKLGDDTNFWGPAGTTGPCGPCSEIYYDLGEKYSCGQKDCRPGCDCDRYSEVWNLVFPQFDQAPSGERRPLKNRGVDTGMGFERLVSVIQEKDTLFQTDLFTPITEEILVRVNRSELDPEQTVRVNVIADHVRALVFAIADGVIPSNEERGYVLRRLLRRAVRLGRNLGIRDPFLFDLVPRTVQVFSAAYPELTGRRETIALIVKTEEERFLATLDKGLTLLAELTATRRAISAEDAFKLYDTYGFPLELTREIAAEKKITIDEAGFSTRLEQAKEQSRQKAKFTLKGEWKIIREGTGSFVGYDRLEVDTEVLRYNEHDKEVELVLGLTPFYAEAGGQVGDEGEIESGTYRLKVLDTYPFQGMSVCHCRIESGSFSPGPVKARVDPGRRREIARAHTATHLLHAALREVLGDHARQEGSFVEPGRLRFDFMHFKPLSEDELEAVENLVNDRVLAAIAITKLVTSLDEARKMGAMALFGEKYGSQVRVVKIADHSLELCAGTHLDNTAEVGLFKITAQESAAAGIRRIEAIVGRRLFQELRREDEALRELRDLLGTDQEPVKKVAEILNRVRELEKASQADKMKIARAEAERLIKKAADREYLLEGFQNFGIDGLRMIADLLREKTKNLIGILYEENHGRLNYLVFVTPDLTSTHPAGDIVKELRKIWGGGGGGRPHLAEGGGADPQKLPQVAEYLITLAKKSP